MRHLVSRIFAVVLLSVAAPRADSADALTNGLVATFATRSATNILVLPNAAFYLPAPPDGGPTRAVVEGFVSVDLRGQHAFQVEASGAAELFVNGTSVLQFPGGGFSELTKPVRLNKGPNALRLGLAGKEGQPAQARLFWKSRNLALPIPLPSAALSHDAEHPELRAQALVRRGAAAIAEFGCVRCHADGPTEPPDAPKLNGIGARLRSDWMAEWIANPSKFRSDARMPAMASAEEARAMADYLATLGAPGSDGSLGSREEGAKHFEAFQCGRCHSIESQPEAGKTSLSHAGRKFYRAALVEFLKDPSAHHPGSRMPNFRLSDREAADLAAFLAGAANPIAAAAPSERGRELIESKGCLNCHSAPAGQQSTFTAKVLTDLKSLDAGCLDPADGRAPRFAMTEGDREAIRAALQARRHDSLARETPLEFALRETNRLRCSACHDVSDGIIRLDLVGGKIRPEYSEKIISGGLSYKPRPWLAARMPGFHTDSEKLAAGLAALHGVAPITPPEPAIDREMAETGARIVSAAGGFSCVACHPVGSSSGGVVVESPGVNLAYSGERLLKSFFERWVMSPVALDPATKMPVYFDEQGRSQLLDFFEGDGTKQVEAMWHYIRLGDKMPPPPSP